MNEEVDAGIARGRRELDASRLLASEGFFEQAVSRSYYAAFYAAEAALLVLEEARSKYSGVISAFDRFVVVEGGLDRDVGRLLRRLFEGRAAADYGKGASREEAEAALGEAERFVTGVEAWIRTMD